MPNIPVYDAKTPGIDTRPVGRAAGAFADLARTRAYAGEYLGNRISEIGQSVDKVVDAYEEKRATTEISQGAAASAALNAKLSADLNEKINKTDPNLVPGVVDEWTTNALEPELQKFRDSFTTEKGRDYADRVSSSIRQHYFERGAADKATAAGSAVRQNLGALKNNLSAAALNDPTSLNTNLGMVDMSIDAMIEANARWLTPEMTAALRAEGRNTKAEIVKSAGIGMADINPEQAQKDYYTKPQFSEYLDGGDIHVLEGYARQRQNDRQQDAVAMENARIKAAKAAVNKELVKLEVDMMGPDGQMRVPPNAFERLSNIALMPEADVSEVRAMRNGIESIQKDEISGTTRASDPATYEKLRQKLAAGVLTKAETYQARADRLLSNTDTSMFAAGVEGLSVEDPAGRQNEKAFSEFLDGNKKYITDSNPFATQQDPAGDFRYMEFSQDMRVRYQQGLAAGKSKYDLLSPRSPDYIARDIGRYQVPNDFKSQLNSIGKPVLPPAPVPEPGVDRPVPVQDRSRREGESILDFKKRLGLP